ncbi:unnamed protein product [Mytilus coruscus]|uniref:HMCN n=1 Tax=Mytilus coruscus TaxID=42192 RepID=A0A6J8B5Z9_MYTCO|nr:unnamed protein product [Mytilus coruscus]
MTNTSRDYFDETECYDFKDCVLYSFSHDLFDDDTIPDLEFSRNATTILEDQFSELLLNSSRSIKETNRFLNYSNVFCAVPPNVSIEDPNQIALLGSSINIICNVTGDPRPKISWYHNGTLLFGANQDVLLLNNIQQIQEGIYNCIAENVVANISSNDAEIFVQECPPGTFFDNGMCSLCDIGMYQPEKNQQKCIACGSGLTTSATGSKEVSDCVDIDECSNEMFKCEHGCTNTNGSFVCSCRDGYTLHSDGKTCIDQVKSTNIAKIAAGVIAGIAVVIAVLFVFFKLMQPKKTKVKSYPDAVKRPDSVQKPVLKHAFVDPVPTGKN